MSSFHSRSSTFLMTLAAVAALSACGGGGGDGDSTPETHASAEGVYEGSLGAATTGQYAAIVLENGESWALYSFNGGGGFLHAHGSSANGSFSANDVLDYGAAPPVAGTVSASYNASAGTIQGQYVFGNDVVPFSARRSTQGYRYDIPADPASITGNWTLASWADQSMRLQVATDGTLSGTGPSGCLLAGSLTPRPSGKNVFNAALRFSSACAQPDLVANGVAIVVVEDGEPALMVMGQSADRKIGTIALGTRTP
ncbi:MAG: hypothetical protein DI587_10015 [Variovorax paradoxus]|nr:MAG: hypothetical protein DI583_10015 [Variovorax paradoxus]PZQ11792.1 MAG: hypothetical protein DI587_10015 [Variovorax paradoxus]